MRYTKGNKVLTSEGKLHTITDVCNAYGQEMVRLDGNENYVSAEYLFSIQTAIFGN